MYYMYSFFQSSKLLIYFLGYFKYFIKRKTQLPNNLIKILGFTVNIICIILNDLLHLFYLVENFFFLIGFLYVLMINFYN